MGSNRKHIHDDHAHCAHHAHHHHGHHHGHHHHTHNTEGNILLAFFLNLGFALIELIGGILTGSIAILSDALHDFGDSISLGVAWRLEHLAKKGRDSHYSYGYKRFSLLGAIFISSVLIIGSVFVIYASIQRLMAPKEPNVQGMVILAVVGVLVNGFAAFRLSGSHSLNERSVRLHMLEDLLGWIAVLIVSIVMLFWNVPILDPLLSLGITAWILYNVYFNIRDSFKILLQGIPSDVDVDKIVGEIQEIEHVISLHDIHLWTLDGENHIITIHVVYDSNAISTPVHLFELKEKVRERLTAFGLKHATIEMDPMGYSCHMENC
ncbi:cobalt transporter [Porphyromonas macacae]|uniref:Cadmium, cobalt and zinc/H(+)-K(+) antiporter n=1 Tax=Porphyromonas macacae TaxID=28115 RepID=A0A379E9F9_9PORP|nr:cation diffusion facilitator family transporter [Porphyromonas macacae]KGN99910.1 cobalt transporter [Porphyromonas macacae]SUB78238.1 Cadmium, cobalt and zinc/H(+)-K(+) antiporter [Porphyromonas macacae]SUB89179.1 Cadmium, cobalt and zinc/H(+)-K(+) antiporter [Porphyromonas macacae]